MDWLWKFTQDANIDIAHAAIVGFGLIGVGTNNSQISGILRQLYVNYSKEPSNFHRSILRKAYCMPVSHSQDGEG